MDIILDLPPRSERGLDLAGFWIRVVAKLLDGLILGAVTGLCAVMVEDSAMEEMVIGLVVIVLPVVYFCSFEASAKQATLGKLMLGLQVGNKQGGRLSAGAAIARFFSKALSAVTLCIGFMMAGFDPQKQSLHDKIANSYVFYDTP